MIEQIDSIASKGIKTIDGWMDEDITAIIVDKYDDKTKYGFIITYDNMNGEGSNSVTLHKTGFDEYNDGLNWGKIIYTNEINKDNIFEVCNEMNELMKKSINYDPKSSFFK